MMQAHFQKCFTILLSRFIEIFYCDSGYKLSLWEYILQEYWGLNLRNFKNINFKNKSEAEI